MTIGRNKITKLLNLGIAPEIEEEIIELVRNNFFSMAIDEWTDIANIKWLGIVFRVIKDGFIFSTFFDII